MICHNCCTVLCSYLILNHTGVQKEQPTLLKHLQSHVCSKKNENTQKLLDKAIVQFLCNLYFMAKFWRQNMLKRFGFEGQDSITNPNPNIIRLAKITNPNLNIRDSEEKIQIRIRIFVTTLPPWPPSRSNLSAASLMCLLHSLYTSEHARSNLLKYGSSTYL